MSNSHKVSVPESYLEKGRKSLSKGFLPISVIILTYNESKNIADCLESIKELTDDIIIVDSGSTDDTLIIAAKYNVSVYHHPFENYSRQRNWAFQAVDSRYSWILNMDADHRLTKELAWELRDRFSKEIPSDIYGFMASRRTMFLGRWIRYGGHYPVYHGILFRKGYGACEEKEYDQHFIIHGKSQVLNGDVIDIITDSLTTFVDRHNKWATLEANDIMNLASSAGKLKANKKGNVMEQRRYQRMKYYSYPLFWRVFLYSFYRIVLKRGFLDGRQGLIFHFLQGFWFRFLVDAKIYELKQSNKL